MKRIFLVMLILLILTSCELVSLPEETAEETTSVPIRAIATDISTETRPIPYYDYSYISTTYDPRLIQSVSDFMQSDTRPIRGIFIVPDTSCDYRWLAIRVNDDYTMSTYIVERHDDIYFLFGTTYETE